MRLSISVFALTIGLAFSAPHPVSEDAAASLLYKRTCFDGGVTWGGDRGYALAHATEASELFAGSYQPGNARVACYNLSNLKKVDFTLSLRPDVNPRTIGADEAYDGLRKEIEGCDKGGDTTYGNWHYRADPNEGQCVPA